MQRQIYLDSIKGFGIILVILYHCSYVPLDSMLIRGIYAICVPLFFTVNGYLMLRKEHSIRALLSKNLKMLLVIFVWAIISTAVYMWKIGQWDTCPPIECFRILISKSWHISKPHCNHLWFLRTLFILNLFNPILYYFIHYKPKGIYYLIIFLGICTPRFLELLVGKFIITNPFRGWYWYSVLYYTLGYAALGGKLKTDKLSAYWIAVIVFAAILCQYLYNWIFKVGFLHSLNVSHGWVGDIVWDGYNAPFTIILTIAVCILFQRIPWKNNGLLQSIGVCSLPIYLMQTPIQRLWQMALPLDQLKEAYHVCGVILPILTLVTSFIIAKLMAKNKYTAYLITI